MATLTIRMPDLKADRLKALAEKHNISMNKLMEELATQALASFDVESRFRARAARGSRERGLKTLERLNALSDKLPGDVHDDVPHSYTLHKNPAPFEYQKKDD